MADAERKAFETWASHKGLLLPKMGGNYSSSKTEAAWDSWQAALASQADVARDAGRYRWLRENEWDAPIVTLYDGDFDNANGEALDAAIDAAMAAQRGEAGRG